MSSVGLGSRLGIASPDQKIAERRRDLAAGLVHDQQRDALKDEHRRQRDDDRLHAQDGDEKAVEGARTAMPMATPAATISEAATATGLAARRPAPH